MKPFVIILLALSMVTSVEAKKRGGGAAQKQAQQAEKQKQKEKAEREQKRDALKAVMDKKDTNHDGSLSREEYTLGETDAEAAGKKFDEYNKNKDRFLSKSELADLLGI